MDDLNGRAERGELPKDPPVYDNPFPRWYRDAIKSLPQIEDVQFDRENGVYTFRVNLSDDDFEDWAEQTQKTIDDLVTKEMSPGFLNRIKSFFGGREIEQATLAERQKWASENKVQFSYTKGNEAELLADLDAHMHGQSAPRGQGGTMGSIEPPKLVGGDGGMAMGKD
jgi:hypothetical protein